MTSAVVAERLRRSPRDARPPVRIIHLGAGAFHRAHEAWYTAHAADADAWGIAAFTGRTPDVADALAPQDGLYTLIERGEESDRFEVVTSIVEVVRGDDLAAFLAYATRPEVAVISLTVTEAGYRLAPDGSPDSSDPAVAGDIAALRSIVRNDLPLADAPVQTALGRVLLALEARRRAGAPAVAVVPCDNIADNGRVVRDALHRLASLVDEEFAASLRPGMTVVSTSVDRITPEATDADRAAVLVATGVVDESPVVTETFRDWVLSGVFPSGRPAWESAGAGFVDDIEPWENRKLWMLNGAHTVLAALGPLRGHKTVSEAISDPACLQVVRDLWSEDARHLPGVEVDEYATQLLKRFRNPRIEHRLAQIARDSETKVRLRIVPVALRERAAGRSAVGCAAAIAIWLLAEQSNAGAAAGTPTAKSLVRLHPDLAADAGFCDTIALAFAAASVLIQP